MSRVTTANMCYARHELVIAGEPRIFLCQRARDHRGYHHQAGVEWGKLWDPEDGPPPPRPARAAAPPPRPR